MADECIRRSDVQDALHSAISEWNKDCGIARMEYLRIRLNNIPAADVVGVVRCKDCQCGNKSIDLFGNPAIECEVNGETQPIDWFCVGATPREDT